MLYLKTTLSKKKLLKAVFLALSLSYSLSLFLHAVEIHPAAGTTSASFLKLGVGARAMGMAGTFTALADDATALYWNPAGLAQLNYPELHVIHNESFESIRHDFIAYTQPFMKGNAACAMYGLYTPQDIERRSGLNENDPFEPLTPPDGYFEAHDIAFHFSYARWLKENLAAGASLKAIHQSIDNQNAYGAAVDAGALYRMDTMPLTLGCVLQNLGTPIKFREKGYILPINMKLGGAYYWNKKIVTTLDFSKPIDNFLFVSAGAEYTPIYFLSLRAGYRYRWYGLELGDLSGLTAGFGFTFPLNRSSLTIDYALTTFGDLGNSHRISLGMYFGPPKSSTKKTMLEKSKAYAKGRTRSEKISDPASMLSGTSGSASVYTSYKFKVTSKLKMISGRFTRYTIRGVSAESILQSWEGIAQSWDAPSFEATVAEKAGEDNIYRHFAIKKDSVLPIRNVKYKLRLPKADNVKKPIIVCKDKTKVKPEAISEDEKYIYYSFRLDTLQSFWIEK